MGNTSWKVNSVQLQNTCDFGGLFLALSLGGGWVCSPLVLPSSDMISTNNNLGDQPRETQKGIIKLPKLGWNDTHLNVCAEFFSWEFPGNYFWIFTPQWAKSWSNWIHFSDALVRCNPPPIGKLPFRRPTTWGDVTLRRPANIRIIMPATFDSQGGVRSPGWWVSKGCIVFFSEIRW